MPRNTLSDLNNHLFAQIERLNDESISDEDLKKEIQRSRALNEVSGMIIDNARTVLAGVKVFNDHLDQNKKIPEQFRLTK